MKIDLPAARLAQLAPDVNAPLPPDATQVATAAGVFRIDRLQLTLGKSAGVEVIVIDSGLVRAALIPTRGMSLWRANMDGLDCSWKSPVHGPIHPQWVPLAEPNGLGWLDGFDELLVRCGLQSFGAPDYSAAGQLKFPLHGRIGNLPATRWWIEVDKAHSLLEVVGEVHETRFLQSNLRLTARYRFAWGQPTIEISDEVANASDTPTTMQMLYHINIGTPLLHAGASLHLPTQRVVARDAHAAADVRDWRSYPGPTPGYVEQVYFSSPLADRHGWSAALLAGQDLRSGFAVHYRPDTLPYFSQWKNTVGSADGYVTGLEPGTGFPNPRSFEERQGRVVSLTGGQAIEFQLKLEGVGSAHRMQALMDQIQTLRQGDTTEEVAFDPNWCLPR